MLHCLCSAGPVQVVSHPSINHRWAMPSFLKNSRTASCNTPCPHSNLLTVWLAFSAYTTSVSLSIIDPTYPFEALLYNASERRNIKN